MIRELKFRAWNILNKTMYMDIQNGISGQNKKGRLVLGTSFGTICKDAGSKVMQFTGLIDKNGKEIYEGDIVRSLKYNDIALKMTGIVKYNNENASFSIDCYSEFENLKGEFYFRNDRFYEIIGNVYENPELLSE